MGVGIVSILFREYRTSYRRHAGCRPGDMPFIFLCPSPSLWPHSSDGHSNRNGNNSRSLDEMPTCYFYCMFSYQGCSLQLVFKDLARNTTMECLYPSFFMSARSQPVCNKFHLVVPPPSRGHLFPRFSAAVRP